MKACSALVMLLLISLSEGRSDVLLGSPPSQTGVSAAAGSFNPIFSGDGQSLVFISQAGNLVTNAVPTSRLQVFHRSLATSNMTLISAGLGGGGADADANYPSVSADGRFVAFASAAGNLWPGDTNGASDVFLRDMVAGQTRLVSVPPSGGVAPDNAGTTGNWLNQPLSGYPQISADGRYVFFVSRIAELATNGSAANVFRFDAWSNVTVLASENVQAPFAYLPRCEFESITPDGRWVAYTVTTNASSPVDAFVRNVETSQTYPISSNLTSFITSASYRCLPPQLSADGRYVAFLASSAEGQGFAFRHELQTATTTLISTSATNLSHGLQISADGRFVLYQENQGGLARSRLWDAQSGTSADLACDGGESRNPHMTPDASRVVFQACSNLYLRDIVAGTNLLVGAMPAGQASSGDFLFSNFQVSPDGTRVAFDTTAADLVAGDWNGASDIFLRDASAGATELVTTASPSRSARTSSAHSFLGRNSVSANGRFVVSTRYDDPSHPLDTNGCLDVYVTDLWSNKVVAVSLNPAGGNTNSFADAIISADGTTIVATRTSPGNPIIMGVRSENGEFTESGLMKFSLGDGVDSGSSFAPSLSADGRALVFTTSSQFSYTNGVDGGVGRDVVVRRMVPGATNLVEGVTDLVSVNLSGTTESFASSTNGIISQDGRWVIFESSATALVTNSTGGKLCLFARDLWSNTTHLVNLPLPVEGVLPVSPGSARISSDSQWVTFLLGNPVRAAVAHDLSGRINRDLEPPSLGKPFSLPEPGPEGRFVAVSYQYLNGPVEGYVFDLLTGERTQVFSLFRSWLNRGLMVGPTKRYEVFTGVFASRDFGYDAPITSADTNHFTDVFVRDRLLGTTTLLSANASGRSGNGPSTQPVMAADGRTVVFQSFASDLAAGDYNDKRDLFVVKLGGVDSDDDGLDDDWEVAYFGNLDRDGAGDFDQDGQTNQQEFLVGTDPTNQGSIFRTMTLAPVGGGNPLILWTGGSDRTYRVEYKDDLGAAVWTPLNGTISWNGQTGSMVDPTGGAQSHRFYRVVRVP